MSPNNPVPQVVEQVPEVVKNPALHERQLVAVIVHVKQLVSQI